MNSLIAINPFYAARLKRQPSSTARQVRSPVPGEIRVVQIGTATLYNGDCFDVMPMLEPVGAVVTDPPYGIGFKYRSYDDAPERYNAMMEKTGSLGHQSGPRWTMLHVAKPAQSRPVAPLVSQRLSHHRCLQDLSGSRREEELPELGPDPLLERTLAHL